MDRVAFGRLVWKLNDAMESEVRRIFNEEGITGSWSEIQATQANDGEHDTDELAKEFLFAAGVYPEAA